jgi:hypothetical protein
MLKTNKFFISIFLFGTISYSQGPGISSNPNPADSSVDVFWFFQNLSWTNPSNSVNIKVSVGIHPNFLTELYNGAVINNFQIPSPLEIRKTYYWRIDEIDSTGISEGNVWIFTTKNSFEYIFIDSFSTHLANWTVTHSSDSCSWKIINTDSSFVVFPPTARAYAVCSDNLFCTNERVINVMELTNPPDLSSYTRCGIGWDNDLFLNNLLDTAYVEISKDGGISWLKVWDREGTNQRKSQERIWLGFRFSWDLRIRFRSSFQGKNSWWAIDNFYTFGNALTYFPEIPPNNLIYNLNIGDSLNVLLQWQQGVGPPSVDRYRIQKKLGDSLSQFAYFTIGETDLNTFSFLDTKVNENVEYSYRVGICEGPLQGWNSLPLTLLVLPLPVELTTFYATIENYNVTLHWETSTETNNKGFEIQRLKDSKVEKLQDWKSVGFVTGNGTTTQINSYFFNDDNLTSGKYSYRLKQIDYDGSYKYYNLSEIIEIDVPSKFELIQNYPNPFNSSTKISWQSPISGWQTLKVFDVLGREVATLVNEEKEAGYHSVDFNASDLPSGVYFYRIQAGNFIDTKKMILLK